MSITSQPPENGFAPWSLMGPSQGSSPSKSPPKANLIQLEPKAAGQMPVKSESAEESDGLSFGDFLDVINPLQHIPVVSTIYREITGDDIGAPARIAGGTLFGGVIGLAAGVINSVVDDSSGKDVGEHIVAAFTGDQNPESSDTKTTEFEEYKVYCKCQYTNSCTNADASYIAKREFSTKPNNNLRSIQNTCTGFTQ